MRWSAEDQYAYLVPLRASGSKCPLFCVHGGDGDVIGFQELVDALSEDQPVFGLTTAKIDGVQTPITVEEFAGTYVREVRRLMKSGPYQLCGYSFGALVAFEMATLLAEASEDVPVLALLDSTNAAYYRNMPWLDRLRFTTTKLVDRGKRYARRIAGGRFDLIWKSAVYFIRKHVSLIMWRIMYRLRGRQRRPIADREAEKLTMSKAIAHSYVPRIFPGHVIIFRPEERAPEYGHDPSLGWAQVAGGGADVHYIPGDHLSFMCQPYVGDLARQLESYLG